MIATSKLTTEMLTILGADTVTLAAACFVIPIKVPFTPGETLTLTDDDMADFTGSTPKATGAATRPVLTDPATGDQFLNMPSPAGGFRWTATATTNLPQTIYGAVLGSSSTTIEGDVLYGSQLLPENPVEINASGDSVAIDFVTFTLIPPGLQ